MALQPAARPTPAALDRRHRDHPQPHRQPRRGRAGDHPPGQHHRRGPARREGPGPGPRARRARPPSCASGRCCRDARPPADRRRRRPAAPRPSPAGSTPPTGADRHGADHASPRRPPRPCRRRPPATALRRRPRRRRRPAAATTTTPAPDGRRRHDHAAGDQDTAGRRRSSSPSRRAATTCCYQLGPAFALGEDAIVDAPRPACRTAVGGRPRRCKDGDKGLDAWNTWRRSATASEADCPTGGMAIVLDGTVDLGARAARPAVFTDTNVQSPAAATASRRARPRTWPGAAYGALPVELKPQARRRPCRPRSARTRCTPA